MSYKPANATELLDKAATDKLCITWDIAHAARALRERPWKWNRVVPKWWVEMKREDLLKQLRAEMEKRKMLTVTGTAEFQNEGKELDLKVMIQPHTPQEHDMLERATKFYDIESLKMENGQLVLRETLRVPPVSVPQSESPATLPSE